jgi:hypothetical protein
VTAARKAAQTSKSDRNEYPNDEYTKRDDEAAVSSGTEKIRQKREERGRGEGGELK